MYEPAPNSSPPAGPAVGVDVSGIELAGLDELPRLDGGLVDASRLTRWLLQHPAEDLLTDCEVLEHAAAWERLSTFTKAQSIATMTEFARRPEYIGPNPEHALQRRRAKGEVARRHPDDELAARLGISARSAGAHLDVGLTLSQRLPATRTAFATGRLDLSKTRVIVDACVAIDDEAAATVEAKVLPRAVEQDLTKLRKRVRRAVIAVDPANAEERRLRCRAERRVWITPTDDGMAWLTALLPAAVALTIEKAVNAAARTAKADADPADDRTLEQLRADMLVWPFRQALQDGALIGPTDVTLMRHRGQLPQIHVTVAANTLLGIDELPAELHGYGPVTAQTARGIAAEGTWRRILTDPTSGTLLDVGTTTYSPPADMARHVEIRDQTCRYPSCNRPATRAELDHTVPFPIGPTAASNLAVLCCRHHQLKHAEPVDESQPRLRQPSPGQLQWTMPTGHSYSVEPPAIGPVEEQGNDGQPDRHAA